MAGHLKPSNATACVFVDLFLWDLLLFLHVFAFLCICVSICVSRGQLVGACSLVCRNQKLTQESWLLLTIGPADEAQAFRLSRRFLAASLFGF